MNAKHKAFKWVCHELRISLDTGEVYFNAQTAILQEFKKAFKAQCHQPTSEGMIALKAALPKAATHLLAEEQVVKAVESAYRVGDSHPGAPLSFMDTRAESGVDRPAGVGFTWHKGARVRRS